MASEATMGRINQQHTQRSNLARRILAWLVHARRPLSFGEIKHALATQLGKSSIDFGDTYAEEAVLSVCAGLVTLNDKDGTLRLIHYTAQEYFQDTWMRWFPHESVAIVDTCLAYLSFDEFKGGPCVDREALRLRKTHYGLLEYAAKHWSSHLGDQDRLAEVDKTKTDMVMSFSKDAFLVQSTMQAVHADFYPGMHGIHLSAFLGLKDLTMLLIETGQAVDIEDALERTPLWWAADKGYVDLVTALLHTQSVDINKTERLGVNGSLCQTPLIRAAENGHEAVVNVLLTEEQIVVDVVELFGCIALSRAAHNGY